jgi:aminoglycoside phosphotransferase (APT) family kinase protein
MTSSSSEVSVQSLTESASRIVGELLGTRVRTVAFLHQGMMTFKCRVHTERGDDVIVRFYPSKRANLVHQEPDLLIRCRQAGLPVPQPLGDSRTGPHSTLQYVAYRRIEGETLATRLSSLDNARRSVLAKDLAHHLHQLQYLTFEGAGDLISSISAHDIAWNLFVDQAMLTGLASIKDHGLLEVPLIRAIDDVVSRGKRGSASATQRLIWGDINFNNILVDEHGRVAGLIDFEGCLSGDPLATLGYAAAFHGTESFFAQLRSAWPDDLSKDQDDLIAWYTLLRAARLAKYAHLPLPTGRARDPLIQIVPGIIPALQRLTAIL